MFFLFAFCVTLYQDFDLLSKSNLGSTHSQQPPASENVTNIAFFIQTYSKTIHLLPSLLEVVWHPDNVYAVHIDAEVPDAHITGVRAMLQDPKYANVMLMPREHVTYLGITTLLSTIDAMSFLLKQPRHWEYFVNLSGADYPLLKPERIRAMLSLPEIRAGRLNFVQSYNDPRVVRDQVYDSRFQTMWVDTALWANLATRPDERGSNVDSDDSGPGTDGEQQRNCKHGCLWKSDASAHPLLYNRAHGRLPIVKTEAWVTLHRDFVLHVVESPMSRRLQAIIANMACPEEFFFGTLLQLSTQFRNTTVYDAFRCVLWTHKRYKGSRPPELDSGKVANVTGILESSGAMFSRKLMKRVSTVKSFVDAELIGLWDPPADLNVVSQPLRSERYLATVERRVKCMVKLRWRWTRNYSAYLACMRSR